MAKSDKEIILELTIRKDNLEKGIVKLESTIEKAKKKNEDYSLSLKKVELAEIKLATTSAKLEKAQKRLDKTVVQSGKKMTQVKDATGSATAATMELSRVISDAPYGIRGMANNITQLVSQLGTASTKAGGLTAALRMMWTAMMGPLGVVFAITAVISALDYFYGANEKAENSTDDLTNSIQGLADVLSKNANVSIREYINLLKEKSALDKQLKKAADDIIAVEDKLAEATRVRAILERNLGKAIHNRDLIQKTLNQATERELELQQELEGIYSDSAKAVNVYRENKKKLSEEDEENSTNDKKPIPFSVKWYENAISSLKKFRDEQLKAGSDVYNQESKNIERLQKELDKLRGKEAKPRDKASSVKLNWEIAPTTTIEKKKRKKLMKQMMDDFVSETNLDLIKNPLEIVPVLDVKLPDSFYENLAKDKTDKLKEFTLTSQLEDFEEYADLVKQSVSAVSSFISGEYERELAIEQNKTNALNEELNNRLINENLSKDQRKKIQDQIANNDEKLRKKQDAINRKKFNAEKAANIAMTLMNTATAAVGVMKDAKGGFFARLSQALPTIAFGLAQVATIARTKYQTAAPSTPSRTSGGGSGVGDGGGDRSFNFNLVGASQQNQLLNAIQSKFETPLKAFVVSKDITTQQELDVNIKGTATL